MKRTSRLVSALILCLIFIVHLCPVAFAESPTTPPDLNLTVTAPDPSIVLGNNIKITVTAENKSASYSMDFLKFTLKYDRGILNCQASSVTTDDTHSGLMAVDDANGLIIQYIADGSATKKALAPGEKMEIAFVMTPAVTTATPVTVSLDGVQTYARTDIANSSINFDNIKHTFTVNQPYSSLSMTFRTRSGNANLNTLSVKVGNEEKALSPMFSANVTAYTFSAEEPVGAVTITCTCQDAGATYKQTQSGSVYTITVTAEDGTTKNYTITLNTVTTTTTTTTTAAPTTTTTAAPTTTTTFDSYTTPTEATQPTDASSAEGSVSDSTVSVDDSKSEGLLASIKISVLGLIGIVAGEIGLFMLAFLSGYMTHKNASRPAKITLEDLVAAHAHAEQEGYEDEDNQTGSMMDEHNIMPDLSAEPFNPQFSAQVNFPTDAMGMQPGYENMGMPGMDGMGMQPGYENMGAPGMDGMGMQPGYENMGAPGMDGMNMQPGYENMGAPGMDGMGMQPGYENMGAPGMDGMNMQPGYENMGMPGMDGMGMQPGYDGMGAPGMDGMQSGYDMNGMGMPPGYGM